MRLYLSSYGLGNNPEEMMPLIGDNKRTAIIMNAQDNVLPEARSERLQREIENLTSLGLQPEELDLRDYFGKTEELKAILANFGYFWVRGGNVFLLRRAYKQSGFDSLLVELLQNDKVAYGGFSAGICVLAPSLKGIELVDPKDDVSEGYEKSVIWDGLGVLGYAIAPHYKSDHPESADIDRCVDYFKENDIAYKTLKDGEAIVINGDKEKIVS
jgi:dipeptidase E